VLSASVLEGFAVLHACCHRGPGAAGSVQRFKESRQCHDDMMGMLNRRMRLADIWACCLFGRRRHGLLRCCGCRECGLVSLSQGTDAYVAGSARTPAACMRCPVLCAHGRMWPGCAVWCVIGLPHSSVCMFWGRYFHRVPARVCCRACIPWAGRESASLLLRFGAGVGL
jgi:hypothetical protein